MPISANGCDGPARTTSGYVPWRFELSFGLGRRPRAAPRRPPIGTGRDRPRLRHRAPRLDRSRRATPERQDPGHRSQDRQGQSLRRGQLIDGGKSLQPLLYALAAEKLFAGEAEVSRPAGSISARPSAGLPSRLFRSTAARERPPFSLPRRSGRRSPSLSFRPPRTRGNASSATTGSSAGPTRSSGRRESRARRSSRFSALRSLP